MSKAKKLGLIGSCLPNSRMDERRRKFHQRRLESVDKHNEFAIERNQRRRHQKMIAQAYHEKYGGTSC